MRCSFCREHRTKECVPQKLCQQGIILLQTPSRQGHHSRSLRLFIIICCCFVAIVLKRGKIFTFNFILNMICLVTKKVRWSIRFRCKAPITTFSTIGQRIFFFFFFPRKGRGKLPPSTPLQFRFANSSRLENCENSFQ